MVLITATAQGQVEALERHYAALGRDAAAVRMAEAIAMAAVRIEEGAGPFASAPRPYPDLADLGWRWLRQGRYWVAFDTPGEGRHVITGVFYDAADIPRRARPGTTASPARSRRVSRRKP